MSTTTKTMTDAALDAAMREAMVRRNRPAALEAAQEILRRAEADPAADDTAWGRKLAREVLAPRGGDPCPRCRRPLAHFSPSGRGNAACDSCCLAWGA